jgi:hypothetical protein
MLLRIKFKFKTTQSIRDIIKSAAHADVVELVDTLASGAGARKGVGVRVSPSAPLPQHVLLFFNMLDVFSVRYMAIRYVK